MLAHVPCLHNALAHGLRLVGTDVVGTVNEVGVQVIAEHEKPFLVKRTAQRQSCSGTPVAVDARRGNGAATRGLVVDVAHRHGVVGAVVIDTRRNHHASLVGVSKVSVVVNDVLQIFSTTSHIQWVGIIGGTHEVAQVRRPWNYAIFQDKVVLAIF